MINKSWWKIAIWFSYIFNFVFWCFIRSPQISSSTATEIYNLRFNWYKYYIILKYSWRKKFCSIKNTKLFIKSFVDPFVDIALAFSDSSSNSLSISKCFVLFLVKILFKFFILSSKSVFFQMLEISVLLDKFVCANLEVIYSDDNLFNSWVVIHLS